MQVVHIEEEEILDLYCPFCGKHSLNKDGVGEPCSHLQWIDSSETLGDAWYRSDDFPNLAHDLEDCDLLEALQRHFPDDSTILFLLSAAFPGDAEIYILYQLTA